MAHAHSPVHCPSTACDRAATGIVAAGPDLPGTRWRTALAALVSAPARLHRYRNLHAEVVEDAFRAYDCRVHRGDGS